MYLKVSETLFFIIFLVLYYAVLVCILAAPDFFIVLTNQVHRNDERVTVPEILLYVWIASFAYDEFADWVDAGQMSFYVSDFWCVSNLKVWVRCVLIVTGGPGILVLSLSA